MVDQRHPSVQSRPLNPHLLTSASVLLPFRHLQEPRAHTLGHAARSGQCSVLLCLTSSLSCHGGGQLSKQSHPLTVPGGSGNGPEAAQPANCSASLSVSTVPFGKGLSASDSAWLWVLSQSIRRLPDSSSGMLRSGANDTLPERSEQGTRNQPLDGAHHSNGDSADNFAQQHFTVCKAYPGQHFDLHSHSLRERAGVLLCPSPLCRTA